MSPPRNYDEMQDLMLLQNSLTDTIQTRQVLDLARHVRKLWEHVGRLEQAVTWSADTIKLEHGDSSMVMKKDGTVIIRGRDITIQAAGKVTIRAASDVSLDAGRNFTAAGRGEVSIEGGRDVMVKAVSKLTLKGTQIQEG